MAAGVQVLHEAAMHGDLERLELLRVGGWNIAETDRNGWTALHFACVTGELEVARWLVAQGVGVDSRNSLGQTALHTAAGNGQLEVAQWLDANGADVTATSLSGQTALHIAASQGQRRVAEWLLQRGLDPAAADAGGNTACHTACEAGRSNLVEWLLQERDADPEARNSAGRSVRDLAEARGMAEILILLRQIDGRRRKAAAQRRGQGSDDRKTGHEILKAARLGDLAELQRHHSAGHNLHYKSRPGWTALMEAAGQNQVAALRWLVEQGLSVAALNKTGYSATHIAADGGHIEAVEALLALGADPMAPTRSGKTVMDVAREGRHQLLVDWLVARQRSAAGTGTGTGGTPGGGKSRRRRGRRRASTTTAEEEAREQEAEDEEGGAGADGEDDNDEDDLERWLRDLELTQYSDTLRDNGFDTLSRLATIEPEDLTDMGFKLGHKRAFLKAYRSLLSPQAGPHVSFEPPPPPLRAAKSQPDMGAAAAEADAASSPKSHSQPELLQARSAAVAVAVAAAPVTKAHEINYDELDFGAVLGEGSFGVVRRASWRGMQVAVKQLKGDQALDSREMRHEADMMARVCNHNNVVQFVGVVLRPVVCVVTQLMALGSVEDVLSLSSPSSRRAQLPLATIYRMALDAAAGVLHLHREAVIHRDLASRNLLVDEQYRVRVADFGFSRAKKESQSRGYTSSQCGPIKWWPPESLRYKAYSEKTDSFSFGVVLYEMLTGLPPWQGLENLDVVIRVCQGERMTVPDEVAPNLRRLIHRCWEAEPSERPHIHEIIEVLRGELAALEGPPPLKAPADEKPSPTAAAASTSTEASLERVPSAEAYTDLGEDFGSGASLPGPEEMGA